MASVVHRGPEGIVYKPAEYRDIPELDLLTLLFDSKWCQAKGDPVISADAADPSKSVTKSQLQAVFKQGAYALRHTYAIGRNGPNKDVVMVMTTGNYMLPALFYAVLAADGIYSAASPASTASELASLMKLVEPKLIICNRDTRAVVMEATTKISFRKDRLLELGDAPTLELREVISGRALPISPSASLDWQRITSLKALEDSIACVLFSSGTTGPFKGVKLSHRSLVSSAYLTIQPSKEKFARDNHHFEYRTIAHLPAAHIAGIQGYLINPTYWSGTQYWMPRFDFGKFIEYSRKYKITFFFTVPPIFLAIAKHPGVTDHFDTIDHAYSGAAPLGPQTQAEAGRKLGKGKAQMVQTWGLTETNGSVTAMPRGIHDDTGSVSPLIGNHEARIVDDNGKDVEPGQPGEVWVRGPVVMKGYWKNEKADRESFVDGWFCTGDIGLFKNGMFYIVDRKKELIKYKGMQVAPAELEALLLSHPQIQDAAVIGVEKVGTEVPRAYVVVDTKQISSEDIMQWVDRQVASHKKLRGGVFLVDEIPKSPSGKILKKLLREKAKMEKSAKL